MRFDATKLADVFMITMEPNADERGSFSRLFCAEDFASRGLAAGIEQASVSFNPTQGTLRGLHYQAAPHGECKLIRCTRGAAYDVLVDVRPESPTYCEWVSAELREGTDHLIYAGEGLAHGFLTLAADTEIEYLISRPYVAEASRGARWNDPAFGIEWPAPVTVISERDGSYPDFA